MIDITTGWINVNTDCNNRCKWCYLKEQIIEPSQSLSYTKAGQVIDLFSELDILSCIFIGGEPTLYPYLPQLVQRAKDRGIPEVTVVSNGRRLHDVRYLQSLIDAKIDTFSITLHSTKKELHDLISRRKAYRTASAGVKNIIKSGKKCLINLVVNEDNAIDVPETIDTLLEWGVHGVIVTCANPLLREDGIDGSQSHDPKKFVQVIERLVDYQKNIIILHELPLCIIPKEIFLSLLRQERIGFGCHIGIGNGVVVDAKGDIIPCNSMSRHELISLFEGEKIKYSADEFLEIWNNNGDVKDFRRQANMHIVEQCRTCELWQVCNSGCPIIWGHYDPNDYVNESFHDITLSSIQKLMKGGGEL